MKVLTAPSLISVAESQVHLTHSSDVMNKQEHENTQSKQRIKKKKTSDVNPSEVHCAAKDICNKHT